MKKKYLFVSQSASVEKNNFNYFGEYFSSLLSFLVKKNDFVLSHKFGINFVLGAFVLFSIVLSFLLWSVLNISSFLECIFWGVMYEWIWWFDSLAWKGIKKAFCFKKGFVFKSKVIELIFLGDRENE